jgi:bifunctional UDP-N-acetylglucosamine pyrophosphorylase/glucosamine-1-phosphate N-acetyltransferase
MMTYAVIIMAGGDGKRMKSNIPKVLHPVLGIPMLVRIIQTVNLTIPCKILVVVGKHRNIIEDELNKYNLNNLVTFVDQPQSNGTGHAVMCCKSELEKFDDNTKIIVLNGDMPFINKNLIQEMLNNNATNIVTTTVVEDNTTSGKVLTNNNKFVKIVEVKDATPEILKIKLINCGLYCFRNQDLIQSFNYLKNFNSQNEYYITDIPEIINVKLNKDVHIQMISTENQHYVCGVNTTEELLALEKIAKTLNLHL